MESMSIQFAELHAVILLFLLAQLCSFIYTKVKVNGIQFASTPV